MTRTATWTAQSIRELEVTSIREFVAGAVEWHGRVLDYGCGRQPYRQIILDAGADYTGYDRVDFPANVSRGNFGPDDPLEQTWDGILCNQIVQYVPNVYMLLRAFREALAPGGVLVMTGPGCWPEVEPEDLHRFTRAGIRRLVGNAGFDVERVEERAAVELAGFRFSLGWGIVGRAGTDDQERGYMK